MIDEKIIAAYEKVKDVKSVFGPQPSPDWATLFNYYNENHPYRRPLSMSCRPCYGKVLGFVSDQIEIVRGEKIIAAYNKCKSTDRDKCKDEWLQLFYFFNQHVPENKMILFDDACEICYGRVLSIVGSKIQDLYDTGPVT